MDDKRIPKRILKINIIGKRRVGKPRKRWVNEVEIDSREVLKMKLEKNVGRQVQRCR
jgi:hypothetical protein